MTTPAESVRQDRGTTGSYVVTRNWVPTPSTETWSGLYGNRTKVRPASTSNPVRPGVGRPPSGWSHQWMDLAVPPRSGTIRLTDGRYITEYNGLFNLMASNGLLGVRTVASWSVGSSYFPFSVDQKARTAFFNKLSANRAQLGATLGELRATARGVTSAAVDVSRGLESIARAYKSSKKAIVNEILNFGKPRNGRPHREAVSERAYRRAEGIRDRWLEYQFGVKPLLNDIEDVGQALSDALFTEKRELHATVRAGATDESVDWVVLNGANTPPITTRVRVRVSTSQHISAVYRIPVTGARTLNELGLGNPMSVAWELTQLSWMVDYLLGVGDWLDSLTSDVGTQFIEGSISRIQRVVYDGNVELKLPSSAWTWLKRPTPEIKLEGGRFVREVLDGRLVLPVLPQLKTKIGLSQMANSLAAISSLMGRRR